MTRLISCKVFHVLICCAVVAIIRVLFTVMSWLLVPLVKWVTGSVATTVNKTCIISLNGVSGEYIIIIQEEILVNMYSMAVVQMDDLSSWCLGWMPGALGDLSSRCLGWMPGALGDLSSWMPGALGDLSSWMPGAQYKMKILLKKF